MSDEPDLRDVPEARPVSRGRRSVQLVWILPLVAAVIGGFLAVRAVLSHGPTITIRFNSAEGIEAGRTHIKYKSVDVGIVKSVTLADDRAGIIVKADMSKAAGPLLVTDSRFWVVRPRISAGAVTGLTTLVSGAFIGMDAGTAKESHHDFVGLEKPPVITSGMVGKEFILRSEDIGSLEIGSPVYFRRLQAGQVVDYELSDTGKDVLVKVFVNAPFDRYVTANTRFWHASGVDVSIDASGLRVDTQSVASILLGGVAFQSPDELATLAPIAAGARFSLYDTRATAMSQPDMPPEVYALEFEGSVRGLAVGAPVDFRGLSVGRVASIDLHRDRVNRRYPIVVQIEVQSEKIVGRDRAPQPDGQPALAPLVARGLRAQMRQANLLTGQQYIALDFIPGAVKASLDLAQKPPRIPTVGGSLQELQTTIASIAAKLDKVPIERIGNDVSTMVRTANTVLNRIDTEITPNARDALRSANKTLDQFQNEIAPEVREAVTEARKAMASLNRAAAETGPLQQQAGETLRELERAARAFRVLADYLERHPESLLRGKKDTQ
jgi:paraquat-inducible protein B